VDKEAFDGFVEELIHRPPFDLAESFKRRALLVVHA
jgi:hypothetical protein